jgi:glycosyltransferase involved in cell wall biosynthesis
LIGECFREIIGSGGNAADPLNPMISFIVPAYNEESLIAHTLAALNDVGRNLTEPYEIIVADDDSSDRTAAVAEELGARVVRARHRQIAATRNEGARAAAGDKFFFVDADTLVNRDVIHAALQAMRDGAVGGGSAIRFDGRLPTWARLVHPAFTFACRVLGMAGGCFLFCTREAFDAVGGFDEERYWAEEVVMSRALGRVGRFVVLREFVLTSGRKLRMYSGAEMLSILFRLTLRGNNAVHYRKGMELWYGERRPDPRLAETGD